MRAIVQRVNHATLSVDEKIISKIGEGYLVFVGYRNEDTIDIIKYIVDRVVGMRVFRDENGKLNKTLLDIGGDIMVVSNFTLYGNCFSNRRPDFKLAAHFDDALPMYNLTLEEFKKKTNNVASGVFGEHMHIDMSNDGPVTLFLEK